MSHVRKEDSHFCSVLWVGAVLLLAQPGTVRADTFEKYRLVDALQLPAGAGPFDILFDGRIVSLVGANVFIENQIQSGHFSLRGPLPAADIPSFGAAFVRVSPDGSRIAVGNNGGVASVDFKVGVFNLASLTGRWFVANHFDAEWIDNTLIALTAGSFGSPGVVTVLDTTSPDPLNPTNTTVVENVGGASGGIAFDAAGNLYTGNGFSFGAANAFSAHAYPFRRQPLQRQRVILYLLGRQNDTGTVSRSLSGTGVVKAFANASWTAALTGGLPVNFETDGSLVVDVLSASPLGFDAEGNLFVGGGDVPPDNDAVALVRASAVTAALSGLGQANPNDPTQVRLLDPIPNDDFNFFSANYNPATNELYVRDFGTATVFVYRDHNNVPTLSHGGLIVMSLLLLSVGSHLIRRRRNRFPCGVSR